jgi:hypothetical protein
MIPAADDKPLTFHDAVRRRLSALNEASAARAQGELALDESRNADDREDVWINSAKRNLHGCMQ